MFFIAEDTGIASYVDDNTPYISANNTNEAIHCLENVTDTLFKWFSDNLMKGNADKYHLLVSTNYTGNIKIENIDITNSSCEKLLGVKFDHKMTFDDHTSELCKQAIRKIHALE